MMNESKRRFMKTAATMFGAAVVSPYYTLAETIEEGKPLKNIDLDSDMNSLVFSADGFFMYIKDPTQNKIYEYGLSESWDTSTSVYHKTWKLY